jgi:hypothetical protein
MWLMIGGTVSSFPYSKLDVIFSPYLSFQLSPRYFRIADLTRSFSGSSLSHIWVDSRPQCSQLLSLTFRV